MFKERLRNLRTANKMSQAELGEKMNVSQQAIGKWELGKANPDPDALIKLADIFNCSTDYLLGRTDSPELEIRKAPPNEGGATNYIVDKDDKDLTVEEIKLFRKFLAEQGCLPKE